MLKEIILNENEIRTILEVFGEIQKKPYNEVNTYLGSVTIAEMVSLREKLNDWYQPNVLDKTYDDELGWVD